jgi:hypothetical protein
MPLRVMNPDPAPEPTIDFAGPNYQPFAESQGIPRPDSPTFAPDNYQTHGLSAQEAIVLHHDQIEDVERMVSVVPPDQEERVSNFVSLHDAVEALKLVSHGTQLPGAFPPLV